jgi:hypothetical protein
MQRKKRGSCKEILNLFLKDNNKCLFFSGLETGKINREELLSPALPTPRIPADQEDTKNANGHMAKPIN